jgi:hypothetical protein
MNTAELEGFPLRVMVAKALGLLYSVVGPEYGIGHRLLIDNQRGYFRPDKDWVQCGDIIAKHWRETTSWLIDHFGPNWRDEIDGTLGSLQLWFCRGLVGSVYGNVVDIDSDGSEAPVERLIRWDELYRS